MTTKREIGVRQVDFVNTGTPAVDGIECIAEIDATTNEIRIHAAAVAGIGVAQDMTDGSATLEIVSTTQGVLLPRMTTTQRDAISTPATGLLVWNTTNGTIDQYNGTAWESYARNPDLGTSEQSSIFWTDFIGFYATLNGFQPTTSGSGAAVTQGWPFIGTVTQAVGVLMAETGTTDAGYAAFHNGNSVLRLDNGAAVNMSGRVLVQDLSTASEEFRVEFGLGNDWWNTSWPSDSVCFRYDRATYSDDNWRAITRHDGTETATDTGVAAKELTGGDSMQVLAIEADEDGAEVRFYIDGTLEATHTTNIPGDNDSMGPGLAILKSAGTTERRVGVDWLRIESVFSAAR